MNGAEYRASYRKAFEQLSPGYLFDDVKNIVTKYGVSSLLETWEMHLVRICPDLEERKECWEFLLELISSVIRCLPQIRGAAINIEPGIDADGSAFIVASCIDSGCYSEWYSRPCQSDRCESLEFHYGWEGNGLGI
ncbi:hypothetical protein ACFQ3J_08910 [Paenibacillus provencensis]|uniref:Uncharacterized protein n=1 Tax=Paenibacillus provencensis TaxID=441151 RepID=A0ABW3PVM8_9BACL|nr:hypothetical protein [Paenibacillus sp. MER 78]MCM3128989.1 hypothetical protein [Paenibacillus sp. MER 78]